MDRLPTRGDLCLSLHSQMQSTPHVQRADHRQSAASVGERLNSSYLQTINLLTGDLFTGKLTSESTFSNNPKKKKPTPKPRSNKMCTPLEGQLKDVNIRDAHHLLGRPVPDDEGALFCIPCKKTKKDIKKLAREGHWTAENLTFVQLLCEEFTERRTIRAFVSDDTFGTPSIILRSPLKQDGLSLFDKRVVEIIILPVKTGFIAAAAYQRCVGEIDSELAKLIQKRINCWRTNLPASLPDRKHAYANWLQ